LAALDAHTGSIRYRCDLKAPVEGAPATDGQHVVFGAGDGSVRCLDAATGELLWEVEVGGAVRSRPLIHEERVYLTADDGCLYALDLRDGEGFWCFATQTMACPSSPALAHGLLVFGAYDGCVYAVDTERGRQRWRYRSPTRGDQFRSSPCIHGETVYIGGLESRALQALSLRDGHVLWSFQAEGYVASSPAVAQGLVYFGSHDHHLYAVDAQSGQQRWRFGTGRTISSSPAVWEGLVFFGSNDGFVYTLEVESGQEAWRFSAGGPVPGSPLVADGQVYVGTLGGLFHALPWHLGQYEWAAGWCARRGWVEECAAYYALAGFPHKAAQVWQEIGQPELGARMWEALGEDDEAARCYERAAEAWRAVNPGRAGDFYGQAARRYALMGRSGESERCDRLAARLRRLPELRLEAFNVPRFRQWEAGNFTLRIVNVGEQAAQSVSLALGGSLADLVTARIVEPLPPGERWDLTLQVTPTAPRAELVVEAEYVDRPGRKPPFRSQLRESIEAEPRPEPAIRIGGDVGLVKITQVDGTAGKPTIEVGGDAGAVVIR